MGNTSSPLRFAMRHNDTDKVRQIVADAGEGAPDLINEDYSADCLLDSCNRNVYSPVHTAVAGGKHAILDILLQNGGDPNTAAMPDGETALHHAARINNIRAARAVVKHGGDVSATDNNGRHALHSAAASIYVRAAKNVDILKYILEDVGKASDVHLADADGNTALHLAAKQDNLAAVRYFLEHGAEVKVTNSQGKTPVDVAKGDTKEYLLNLNP